ncbi:hypothetical protein [Agrobacterium sp.]|uniref:hypothetical protein n=1 Tax=Agrobacterium sp. TaxID=361 RepID=UPI0028AC6738
MPLFGAFHKLGNGIRAGFAVVPQAKQNIIVTIKNQLHAGMSDTVWAGSHNGRFVWQMPECHRASSLYRRQPPKARISVVFKAKNISSKSASRIFHHDAFFTSSSEG